MDGSGTPTMDVLIVEDEPALLESLQDGLRSAFGGYEFLGAPSVERAEELIAEHGDPALVISDIRLPGKSGIEFLIDVQGRRPEVRFVLMSAFPSMMPEEISESRQGLRFLRKPFEFQALVSEVREVLEGDRFTGDVEGITLIELLQVLQIGKKTAALKVRHGKHEGELYIEDGEIVHASLGKTEGVGAFYEIVAWRGCSYSVVSDAAPPRRTVEDSFSFLLLEAMRQIDERERALETNEIPFHKTDPTGKEKVMADLNELCKSLVEDVPDGIASNVIDLSTGMMLAGHFLSNFTSDHFEAVSAAATNLYRGKETLRVENLVKSQRGDKSDTHFMQEVQFSTTNLHHFIIKLPEKDAVLCLVTKKPGNIGMGWAAVRSKVPQVAAIVPS